jgi:hypothetical protein
MRTILTLALSLSVLTLAATAGADPPRGHATRAFQAHGEIVIHGERQRPQQFNVTSRSPLGYTPTAAEPHFVPRVVEATHASPF